MRFISLLKFYNVFDTLTDFIIYVIIVINLNFFNIDVLSDSRRDLKMFWLMLIVSNIALISLLAI